MATSSRLATTRRAPSSANSWAHARPSPREAPVTRYTRSVSPRSMRSSCPRGGVRPFGGVEQCVLLVLGARPATGPDGRTPVVVARGATHQDDEGDQRPEREHEPLQRVGQVRSLVVGRARQGQGRRGGG